MKKCYLVKFWNGEDYEDCDITNLYLILDNELVTTQVQKLNEEYQVKCKRYAELHIPWCKNQLTNEQLKELEELEKTKIGYNYYNPDAEYQYEELDFFAP